VSAEEIRLIRIVGRYRHARVVRLPARQIAIVAGDLPVVAAVVGTPQLTVVGRLVVDRQAVAGLDQCVDTVRVRGRDRETHLAERTDGEPVADETSPRATAVARCIDAAARTTTLASP